MGLADLLDALEADAAAEAAQLEAETQAEVVRLVEAAQTEARALEERLVRTSDAELARDVAGRQAQARLAAAMLVREARADAVRSLLGALHARLATLRATEAYASVFEALVAESLAALPVATVLRVDPRDEQLARRVVQRLDAHVEVQPTLQTAGGVELGSGDGRTVRNTLEERLRNAEPALRLVLGRLLASGTATTGAPSPEVQEAVA